MQTIMEKYFDEIVASTVEILQFDSSLQTAEEGCPFGKGAADCLAYFLNLANSMGFETHNYDNYVGEVVFGEGKPFAILAHLDVVPAGSGWNYPPFGGVINEDPSEGGVLGKKIWGRGAMDDKTPAIVCLYALKALKDEGITPNRTIKLIVGCNEEAGWKCIDHYNKVAQMPEEGFTPDADFPVIYAEKGILHFTMSFPLEEAPMSQLTAGERVNMVADSAMAILTRKAAENLVYYENPVEGTRLSYDNTTNILRVYGKSAHGSTPHLGANALEALLYFLGTFHEGCKKAYDLLFADETGLKNLEDETGKLTMSPDVALYKDGVLHITTDIRFPSTYPLETITEKLDAFGVEYTIDNYQAPLYNDPNGKLISTLVGVYNKITGKNETPIAIGGGTYARALQCGCAFGPEVQGEEATIHQANEYVTFDRIQLMSDVYYSAIKAVCAEEETQAIQTEEPAQESTLEETKTGKTRIAIIKTKRQKIVPTECELVEAILVKEDEAELTTAKAEIIEEAELVEAVELPVEPAKREKKGTVLATAKLKTQKK
ncbi:MAG: Sapep family Mn(2+)-dependent dipeptidase [Clostridia bacterium]|nr:Sapep family Mn(2+)-dependent dipeptidase [Clostridia bacterium]